MAGIQGTGGLANEAFRAALRAQQETAKNMLAGAPNLQATPLPNGGQNPGLAGVSGVEKPGSFAASLKVGMQDVSKQINAAEALPEQLVQGEVGEFHEVALQLKQSDLSFRFALQVRNKLIDAYREVMRMSV